MSDKAYYKIRNPRTKHIEYGILDRYNTAYGDSVIVYSLCGWFLNHKLQHLFSDEKAELMSKLEVLFFVTPYDDRLK